MDEGGGAVRSSFLFLLQLSMIEKSAVSKIVEEWIDGKDYFLVDVTVSPEDRVVVEIDHAEGVWIEDCVELSRYIESKLNREKEDYELEVGSAGIGQPFKVLQQYYNHIDKEVEVLTKAGRKLTGRLKDANEERFIVSVAKKVKEEGSKRPKLVEENETFAYDEVKYTKYLISFK
jgi:ribosome maturation factor RimP